MHRSGVCEGVQCVCEGVRGRYACEREGRGWEGREKGGGGFQRVGSVGLLIANLTSNTITRQASGLM